MIVEFGHAAVRESFYLSMKSPAFFKTRRIVAKRGPFEEKTKPAGASLAHLRNVAGVCER
jgi:hypothetical protein